MPIEVLEKFDSRRVTAGQNPAAEFRYLVRGTDDPTLAINAVVSASPAWFDPWGTSGLFIPRTDLSADPVAFQVWEVVVRYGTTQPVEASYTFETGGGTQHITHAPATLATYVPAGAAPAPDVQGGIGASADSVEGLDVVVPIYQFSETHYLGDEAVTPTYKANLFHLTGRVNAAAFKGFNAGEVLFLGVAGARRGGGDWELTFRFAASPNETDLHVGTITGIAKGGWEYLWVLTEKAEDSPARMCIQRPRAVYVQRVYPSGDFSLLLI